MSDFFKRLEAQRRVEERTKDHQIALGASLGALATTLFISHFVEPSSVLDYLPDFGGALLGAAVAAGIIEPRHK